METIEERILIELVKIAETDVKYMKAVRECAEKERIPYEYYIARLACNYALHLESVKEKLQAGKN